MHTLFLFFIGNLMINSALFSMNRDHDVDYEAYRVLARVNKAYNKKIEDDYKPNKKHIKQVMLDDYFVIIPEETSWNKDFSRCAWISVEQNYSLMNPKKLELTLVELDDNKKDIIVQIGSCDGYYCSAIHDQARPFFDKEGGVFYYGIGDIVGQPEGHAVCLVEYSLTFVNALQIKRCVIGEGETMIHYPHVLINYPLLLKAILKSTQVSDVSGMCAGIEKVYHINGVIIPEDYKIFKKHGFKRYEWEDDHLSQELRKVIDKRYAEQQREKMDTLMGNVIMSSASFGMDSLVCKVDDDKRVAFSVIVADCFSLYDDAHRTLARLNNTYNKMIEDAYRPDKKRIEQLCKVRTSVTIPKQAYWNNDFNRCAWISVEQNYSLMNPKKLELTLVKLDDDKKKIIVQRGSCEGYYCPAIHDQARLFFDKKGDVFYYGVGDIVGQPEGHAVCLVEYSLMSDNALQIKRCVVGEGEAMIYYPHALINYPVLLKAILKSTQVHDRSPFCIGIEKVYYIDGVMIPEDYKAFKKHGFKRYEWQDDYLSDGLNKAVEKRYAEQQCKKTNTHNS